MALDKQKILNELGSVVNQLQSADCGCMGKLFSSNSGQSNPNGSMGSPYGGMNCCGYGHGYHGHNVPCAGEPCSGGAGPRYCMGGGCNPKKIYADTYSYLNRNMMQPVVNEVYNDLKSISPTNTIMNDPMGAKMGLPAGGPGKAMAGGAMGNQNSMMGGQMGNQNQMMGGQMGNQNQMMGGQMGNQNHMMGGQMGNPNQMMGGQMGNQNQMMGGQMGNQNQTMGGQMGNQYSRMGGQMGNQDSMMAGQMGNQNQMMGGQMGNHNQMMGGQMENQNQMMGGHNMRNQNAIMGEQYGHQDPMAAKMPHGHNPHLHFANGDMHTAQMNDPNLQHGIPVDPGSRVPMQHGQGSAGGMMAGMGPQIMQMMMSNAAKKNNSMFDLGQMQPPAATGNNAPQSYEMAQPATMAGDMNQGQVQPGQMHTNPGYGMNSNPDYGMNNNMAQRGSEMQQSIQPAQHSPQYAQQMNAYPATTGNAQYANEMPSNMNQMKPESSPMGNMNPMAQQNGPYGKHSAGMAKFSEMFPGVLKDDLGFDPMSIAFQMNPANQQKSAMSTMENMMMKNSPGINRMMDPNLQKSQPLASPNQPAPTQAYEQQNLAPAAQEYQPVAHTGDIPHQHRYAISAAPSLHQQQPGSTGAVPNQGQNRSPQQVYSMTGAPTMNQQHLYAQQSLPQIGNANTEDGAPSPLNDGSYDPPAYQAPDFTPTKEMLYKEPIFPADTSRNLLHSHHFAKHRQYEYNTIGQPVEKRYDLPDYQQTIPPLPQTLSPMPKYANVKSTVSKTSLMGNKPVGKTPSRSQLQHIYNQYKGSQSFTQHAMPQQGLRPQNLSSSAGKINVARENPHRVPVERVGGDTTANNLNRPAPVKNAPIAEHIGDTPKTPGGDYAWNLSKHTKLRNGLQDQVFRSSPQSAKWTFHGSEPAPPVGGYHRRWR